MNDHSPWQADHDCESGCNETAHSLAWQYRTIRRRFEQYCAPLAIEDYGLQAMPDTSPPKWHLAHTSWFFETFILKEYVASYQPFHPQFEYLFNSYYNGIGAQFPRPRRGLLSRPTVAEIYRYRQVVDEAMLALLERGPDLSADICARTALGLQHEMQHQELFFTDIKYSLAQNPLFPAYLPLADRWLSDVPAPVMQWRRFDGGLTDIGAAADGAFCFDNETPRHPVFIAPFEMADRLITNAEVLAFVLAGGYRDPALWLSDGWQTVREQQWQHPLYWHPPQGEVMAAEGWQEFTLYGLQPLDPHRPACHLSAYEADAIARWLGGRLPTEFEWELAAPQWPDCLTRHDAGHYHPNIADLASLFGAVWQWTSSAYSPYPGYQPAAGAIGEYNGKFMCNQWVLRGGSCVTDPRQIRTSYRNFFYPADRWQFSGLRLARTLQPR